MACHGNNWIFKTRNFFSAKQIIECTTQRLNNKRYCNLWIQYCIAKQRGSLSMSLELRCNSINKYINFSSTFLNGQSPLKNFSRRIFSSCIPLQKHENGHFSKKNHPGLKEDWESLLNNDEKRENISSIPTRRENILTVPNFLSLSRILATPYIAHLAMQGNHVWATSLLVIAGITDILDGQIARRWPSQKSAFGTALDPLGDKILITVLTLTLAKVSLLPLPLAVIIVGRDALLILAVFYLRYRTCPPPLTLKRYFDPTLVNTKLNPTTISKANTVLQVAVICMTISAPIFELSQHPALYAVWGLTGLTTIWSGLDYIFNKNTVQILKETKPE